MYNFILQFAFFAAVGAIIYVISRAVPRVNEIEGESKTPLTAGWRPCLWKKRMLSSARPLKNFYGG